MRGLVSCLAILTCTAHAIATPLPSPPQDPADPGSENYAFSYETITETFNGRTGTLYLPQGAPANQPLVLFAFGHGYGVPQLSYRKTLVHLARKGLAVLFVPYEESRSDRDVPRMAQDYNDFVAEVVKRHSPQLNAQRVVFSGHSTGATVAAMAAGLPPKDMRIRPAEILVFAISGFRPTYYQNIPPEVPCTLAVGEDDTENPVAFTRKVFEVLPCRKQMIVIRSYRSPVSPELLATHGSIRTFGWLGDQTSDLHYFSYWKFMLGAGFDVASGALGTNPWLFGASARQTGLPNLFNEIVTPQEDSTQVNDEH